jgi:hypothetical protein
MQLFHTHTTIYNICAFLATVWDPTITVPFTISFSTQLPETQPLFTISVLVPSYYLKSSHYLQFPCLCPATVLNPSTAYNFCACTQLLSDPATIYKSWSVPNYYLQFLCQYPTIWDPATIYSFCACTQLLFQTQPLFTVSVSVSNCLRPSHYLQLLCLYSAIVSDPATI